MKKILVVEDEPDIQELLGAYLRDTGYDVEIVGDGVAALDRFQKGTFDLILLDLMLPKIDGFGVCELIRRESDVPILMLTALDGEEEQLRGFGLDVDDYVTKPFSMPILLFDHSIASFLCFVDRGPGVCLPLLSLGRLCKCHGGPPKVCHFMGCSN